MLNVLTQPDVRSAPGPLAVAAAVHSIGRFHEIENRSLKFLEGFQTFYSHLPVISLDRAGVLRLNAGGSSPVISRHLP